jgi:hypothetical protein
MKATVRQDVTTRVITLEVRDVPDVDGTKSWHSEGATWKMFRPDHVTITTVNGETDEVKASGPLILKSGEPSTAQRGDKTWSPDNIWSIGERLSTAPSWLRRLVAEAPAGVTLWDDPGQPS